MTAAPAPASADAPIVVWFRQDLRLSDNPALDHAAASGRPILPVFILDDAAAGVWRPGGASRWWLHHSLAALGRDLAAAGAPLLLRRGEAARILPEIVQATGARAVTWNRCYEPWAIARDKVLKSHLADAGIAVHSFNGNLLNEPWTVLTASGAPYRVFTPYWRAVTSGRTPGAPLPSPARLPGMAAPPAGDRLEDWGLLPTKPDWAGGLRETWTPGEAGATARLQAFLDTAARDYAAGRDRPGIDGTSRLSPHLRFGEISPRRIWAAVQDFADRTKAAGVAANAEAFLREIVWREFSHNLLYHFPDLPEQPLNRRFAAFPWQPDPAHLRAWQQGATGYPIVDAGMRQLWHTGWMHNRVRMIVGSLLVKHLLQPWQEGERWFWDTLVDADLANNAAGWQWIAGCGADAAPYFRVFNPMLQGAKFDPDGTYVRRWVPELRHLPDAHIHAPWQAPAEVLRRAGVTLDRDYPAPIVDHAAGRQRALAAFATLKDSAEQDAAAAPVVGKVRKAGRGP